jgi:flavin-dependent dehydrogenase
VVGKVGLNVGVNVTDVKVQNGKAVLQLTDSTGAGKTLTADHVIAATGYRVDLRRLTLLDADLQSRIRSVENTPVLSSNFQSSIPGLYFVGASAANSFGPLLRFAFGAGFTAKRLSNHLAKSTDRKPVVRERVGAEHDEVAAR